MSRDAPRGRRSISQALQRLWQAPACLDAINRQAPKPGSSRGPGWCRFSGRRSWAWLLGAVVTGHRVFDQGTRHIGGVGGVAQHVQAKVAGVQPAVFVQGLAHAAQQLAGVGQGVGGGQVGLEGEIGDEAGWVGDAFFIVDIPIESSGTALRLVSLNWVAAVRGVRPGTIGKPEQAKACPRTAAIKRRLLFPGVSFPDRPKATRGRYS